MGDSVSTSYKCDSSSTSPLELVRNPKHHDSSFSLFLRLKSLLVSLATADELHKDLTRVDRNYI